MTDYYRCKIYFVRAVQYTGKESVEALRELCGADLLDYDEGHECCDPAIAVLTRTGHSWEEVYEGDWVIKHSGYNGGLEVLDNMDFVRDYAPQGA